MSPRTLSETKRLAILEAAAAEFPIRGFQGTSMDRISERAGVSKRTVYNHFPSKDDLFRAIIDRIWKQAQEATDRPFEPAVPLEEQLVEMGRAEIRLLSQEGFLKLARALLAAVIQDPGGAGEKLEEISQRDLGIVSWVQAAIDHGALKETDPRMAGQQFHALIKAFAFWPQLMTGQPPLDDEAAEAVIASAARVFLAAYGR